MKMIKMFSAVVLAAVGSACTPEEDGRVVAAKGYDVPKAWAPIPVMGRTFYGTIEYGVSEQALMKAKPDLAMFDHLWLWTGFRANVNDLAGVDAYTPTNVLWRKRPIRISELCTAHSNRLERLARFEKEYPGHPFCFGMGARPVKILQPSFETDAADFAAWRKAHPGFYSFYVFDEYDNDSASLTWLKGQKFKHPELRQRFIDEYGLDHLEYGFPRKWLDHDFEKVKSLYFGCTDLCGLWSVEISLAHALAAKGLNFLWYEAEHGSTASPWRWGAAYSRGAARQFHIPFGWYTAMYTHNTLTRDGQNPEKVKKGIALWRDSFTYWPNPDSPKKVPHLGASRSLLRRNVRYGYFIGNVLATVECSAYSLYAFAPDGKGWDLSPYGHDYNDIFEWHRHRDRGTLYTPVAMLASMDEGVQRQGCNTFPAKDEGSIFSFLSTLVPARAPGSALFCDPKNGKEGCLWNSEFGEILDVLAPDCGQKSEDFKAALQNYKAAFLVGYHDPKLCDRKAIASYVHDGGTLFCSYDQVADGLVSAHDAGVEFGEKTVLAGKKLLDERGVAVESFGENYTLHVPSVTNAVPFLKDENGSVVAWAAKSGRGRVITVTARRMMPDKFLELKENGWRSYQWLNGLCQTVVKGERTFPIVHQLLKRVQKDVMPIDVAGDVQWGLNKTAKGWMLWLINNNGITKFAFEPEDIDLTKTATVKVDLKDLAGLKPSDITDPIKTVPLSVRDGAFMVSVKPGEDVRIAIE